MNRTKKLCAGFMIVLSLVFVFPQKTEAQYVDIANTLKEYGLDTAAYFAVNLIIRRIATATVNWINSGFRGNPAYVTDPKQFFLDAGDRVVTNYLSSAGPLNSLCTPFRAQVRLNLVRNYLSASEGPTSCSLSILRNNYEQFTNDFSVGGWSGWFEMTQVSGNNPYGAYLDAQIELDNRLAEVAKKYEDQLNRGDGFLSFQRCRPGTEATQASIDAGFDEGLQIGDCAEADKETATPGSVINTQLNKVLAMPTDRIDASDEINEILSALLNQLINRVIGGASSGLRGSSERGPGGRPSFTDDLGNDDLNQQEPDPDYQPPEAPELPDEDNPVPVVIVDGPGGGGGGQCSETGFRYDGALWDAMDAVVAANPALANSPKTRPDQFEFLRLVAEELESMGLNGTEQVLNGNSNPSTGDIIAVWGDGDTMMERYDVIIDAGSGGGTIGGSLSAGFTGFIPLNCTATGGGRNCGCRSGGGGSGGGGTTPTPPPVTPGTPGGPAITSVTPSSATAGVTILTITGTNLARTVQFFDSNGARWSENGTVNTAGTQVTIMVPAGFPNGGATVRIYVNSTTFSNSQSFTVTGTSGGGTSGPTVPTVPGSNFFVPPQTINNWWPELSPDGRYVAYGNFPESWVTDRTTNVSINLSSTTAVAANTNCMRGQWIAVNRLSFVCNINDVSYARYEATGPAFVPVATGDNTGLVAGNRIVAADGHWASYLAGGGRIARDNAVLTTGAGGTLSISGNQLATACNNNNTSICLWTGTTLTRTSTPQVPLNDLTLNGGYIVYGGSGTGLRGITPAGADVNLRLSTRINEGVNRIIFVNGTPWVVTNGWAGSGTGEQGYIFLRPWGSASAIAILAPDGGNVSVAVSGNDFVIAYNNGVGRMTVFTVPIDSQRNPLPQ